MRGFVLIPLAIVAVTIAFLATPARDGVLALLGPDFPIGREPAPGGGGVEFPTLTDEQIARAEEILAADSRAKELLGGQDYTIELVGPSINSDSGSNEVIGASLDIRLSQSMSIEGSWPMVYPSGPGDPAGWSAREVLVYYPDCAAPNGVVKVIAMVDFSQDRLVQLYPLRVPGFDILGSDCKGGSQ